jgi:hypothetical protein
MMMSCITPLQSRCLLTVSYHRDGNSSWNEQQIGLGTGAGKTAVFIPGGTRVRVGC